MCLSTSCQLLIQSKPPVIVYLTVINDVTKSKLEISGAADDDDVQNSTRELLFAQLTGI
jgi:hypothetical protein